MAVEFYRGQTITRGDIFLRLGKKGSVYLSAALAETWPFNDCPYAEVGFDRQARLYVLVPRGDPGDGLMELHRDKRTLRGHCRTALHYFGIQLDYSYQGRPQWVKRGKLQRLEMVLPEVGETQERETAKPALIAAEGDAKGRQGPKRRKGPERTTVPEEQATGDEQPSSVKRQCSTCRHWKSMVGYPESRRICQAVSGPYVGRVTAMRDICDSYERWLAPHGGSIPEGPPPPPRKAAKPKRPATGRRPRGQCCICGRTFPVSAKGIYPHDDDGVAYTAGRGDPTRRCPGSHQPPKA